MSQLKAVPKNGVKRTKKNENILKLWVTAVSNKIKERIVSLKISKPSRVVNEILKDRECLNSLKDLKERFVITPIDKASGNVALICKRFFAKVLIKELGLDALSKSETYQNIKRMTSNRIVQKQTQELKTKFNLEVPDDSKLLPHIYWLPKLHKNPIKFRFIIAAPNCSVNPLSKAVTKILKLFYRQIEKYNSKSDFYLTAKTFWVIQNNEDVLKSISKINRRNSARSINTYDFSTLYTKIPHQKLLEVLNELVDFCFKGGTHEQLSLTNSGAKWVSKSSKTGLIFDRIAIKDAIKYLMGNCYFTFGEKIFRQIIGIPMGSDPAPFMANLFLYHYESNWTKNLKQNSIQRARMFRHTFRYKDDLLTINDNDEFSKSFIDIQL